MTTKNNPAGFSGGDIDGLFGLLVDNLIQLLVILALLKYVINMPGDTILHQVMPAIGVSVIFGNIFYALQAWWGSHREGIKKTALPYGINTPSVFAYIFFIMVPVYYQKGNSWEAAYSAGMLACIGSGLIEFFGAFVAKWIRSTTPRAALLAALAGIALTYISMDFVVRLFADPLIGLIPLVILLAGYFGKAKMPLGLPAGLVALLVGTGLAWALTFLQKFTDISWLLNDPNNVRVPAEVTSSISDAGWFIPDPRIVWPQIMETFKSNEWLSYLGVIIPMGLFNLIGSLQNLESAEAAGDKYSTAPSLMINGAGSILGGFLGSCFPTTIYIGHPGWKSMGAGWAYSLLNAFAIAALCLTGLAAALETIVPITAGASILLWIGVIILAQAFSASPERHGGAVAVGLFPAIAGLIIMIGSAAYGPGPSAIQIVPNTQQQENAQSEILSNNITAQNNSTADIQATDDNTTVPQTQPEAIQHEYRLSTIEEQLQRPIDKSTDTRTWLGFSIHGLIRLERGLLLTSMIWAAITAFLIDRRWRAAAIWAFIACALSILGVIHGYAIMGNNLYYLIPWLDIPEAATKYPAWDFAFAYGLTGIILFIPSMLNRPGNRQPPNNNKYAYPPSTQYADKDQAANLRNKFQPPAYPKSTSHSAKNDEVNEHNPIDLAAAPSSEKIELNKPESPSIRPDIDINQPKSRPLTPPDMNKKDTHSDQLQNDKND